MGLYRKVLDIEGNDILIESTNEAHFYDLIRDRLGQILDWDKDAARCEASTITEEAKERIKSLESLLRDGLQHKNKIDWRLLKNSETFKHSILINERPEPSTFGRLIPQPSIWEFFFPSLKDKRKKKEKEANDRFINALQLWNQELKAADQQYQRKKQAFERKKTNENTKIERLKRDFENKETDAIEYTIGLFLSRSKYPEVIDIKRDVLFDPERNALVIDLDLPAPADIPKVIEFKYIATRSEFVHKEMKAKEFAAFYDDVIAQIVIRTIHEAFSLVYNDAIDFVIVNGYVESVDTSTGQEFQSCILSVQAERDYFKGLNLRKVSALACLKGMKSVVASEFHNLAPVKPILKMNRADRRFIETEDVLESFDSSRNLAEMDWQKFEVLVRDIFAKEFSGDGVDVKVTQASRDAGVDAVVFDPDKIKGGKFIIQAKRYNNVVGISAVRDLYGTVMNEGAVKGILVTTSTFGKDSIDFVKDKPLTLISGQELVYLFRKHGYDVNIKTKKKRRSSPSG